MAFKCDAPMTSRERDALLVVLDACRVFPGRWLYLRELLPPLADRGEAVRAFSRASRRRDFPSGVLEVQGAGASMVRAREGV